MSNIHFPTPHGDKLNSLLTNEKLPHDDKYLVEQALLKYQEWQNELNIIRSPISDRSLF